MVFIFAGKACKKEKYQIIGFCTLHKKKGSFRIRIPERVLQRSETKHYYLRIPGEFAREHYMEELIIECGEWKQSARVERKIAF